MPRLAALGLVQQREGQEKKAEQEEESHTSSSPQLPQPQQQRKKRPRGGQGQWEAHQWARRLRAAGVETAEELLVMEPEFARTLLSSSREEEEEGPASPSPKQRVRRKVGVLSQAGP